MKNWEHWAVRAEVYRSRAEQDTDPERRAFHLGVAANLDRLAELKRRREEISRQFGL